MQTVINFSENGQKRTDFVGPFFQEKLRTNRAKKGQTWGPYPEPKVLWRDAAKGLAVFVKFAEQCTYMTTRDVMAVHCIQNEFSLQRGKSCKQRDIREFF